MSVVSPKTPYLGKLFKLLQIFSSMEIKQFDKFLCSPYFNTDDNMVRFFRILKKEHPNYIHPRLKDEKVFQKVFKGKPFNPKTYNNLKTKLLNLANEFVVNNDFRNNEIKKKEQLIESLGQRNHSEFAKKSEELIKSLNSKKSYFTPRDYLVLSQIYHQLWFHISTEKYSLENNLLIQSQLNLDYFYILSKLYLVGELKLRQNLVKIKKEEILLWNPILQLLKEDKLVSNNPLFLLLMKIEKLHNEEDNLSIFFNLKQEILASKHLIEQAMLRDLIIHLITFGIRQNNEGKKNFNKEVFELYKFMAANEILLENGKIREIEFVNIALFAYRFNEFHWADNFCEKFIKFLDSKLPMDVLAYVYAYKHFFKKRI